MSWGLAKLVVKKIFLIQMKGPKGLLIDIITSFYLILDYWNYYRLFSTLWSHVGQWRFRTRRFFANMVTLKPWKHRFSVPLLHYILHQLSQLSILPSPSLPSSHSRCFRALSDFCSSVHAFNFLLWVCQFIVCWFWLDCGQVEWHFSDSVFFSFISVFSLFV